MYTVRLGSANQFQAVLWWTHFIAFCFGFVPLILKIIFLCRLALSSLQSFVLNFSDWRENTILGKCHLSCNLRTNSCKEIVAIYNSKCYLDLIHYYCNWCGNKHCYKQTEWLFFFFGTGFINVILREIQDNLPSLLDSALRMLLQLLGQWKTALTAGSANVQVRVAKLMTLSNKIIIISDVHPF